MRAKAWTTRSGWVVTVWGARCIRLRTSCAVATNGRTGSRFTANRLLSSYTLGHNRGCLVWQYGEGSGLSCSVGKRSLQETYPRPQIFPHTLSHHPARRSAGEQWPGEPGGAFACPTGSKPAATGRAIPRRRTVPKTGTPRRSASQLNFPEAQSASGSVTNLLNRKPKGRPALRRALRHPIVRALRNGSGTDRSGT